jgi:hypothetical protein
MHSGEPEARHGPELVTVTTCTQPLTSWSPTVPSTCSA